MAVARPTHWRLQSKDLHGGRGENSGCPNQTPETVSAYHGSGSGCETSTDLAGVGALPLTSSGMCTVKALALRTTNGSTGAQSDTTQQVPKGTERRTVAPVNGTDE